MVLVIVLSVSLIVFLNVVMLSFVMLNVVAQTQYVVKSCCISSHPGCFYMYIMISMDTTVVLNVIRKIMAAMGLHHPLDGVTNYEYKLLCFIQLTNFFCKKKRALAFNRDRCCHLALCLRLILFH